MKNLWKDGEARSFVRKYHAYGEDLALRTYSARLIGRDASLVLHGGGNTSVKSRSATLTGERVPVLCVKGSGWDLGEIEPAGHPAVKLDALLALRRLTRLSDEEMVNVLRGNMLDAAGPNPSVEALLHAFLPHKYIDHTHADAVLALADQPDSGAIVEKWARGRLGFVPYIMPGFALAQAAARVYEKDPTVEGLVLDKHGIFTFGSTARESYDRMIFWVGSAERFLGRLRKKVLTTVTVPLRADVQSVGRIANLIRQTCAQDGGVIVRHRATPQILEFAGSREAVRLSQVGPLTPDHVIRTKPRPVCLSHSAVKSWETLEDELKKRVDVFKRDYRSYFIRQSRLKKAVKKPLDPMPRLVIVPGAGLFSAAADAAAADVALDIYEHTISVIEMATRMGRYRPLSESDLFDMEYWSLEQAKLGKTIPLPFARKIVWVSGAGSGIGLATAAAFGRLGAHVFLSDIDAGRLERAASALPFKGRVAWSRCDVTDAGQVQSSFDRCSATFGGVDVAISNAGIAPTGDMANCDPSVLRKSFEVNFFAHQNVAQATARVFERQKLGGCLLFNASKSAFNPGPGFGPYALPKTALVALMKQYAIELGKIGVRCNAVNADRVHTRLFSDGLLRERAQARGLSVRQYLSGNLLRQEVTAEDVAEAFVFLAQAKKTTGATLPVDGGNAAAFPR